MKRSYLKTYLARRKREERARAPVTFKGITLKYDCPTPQRFTQDQYRCSVCGMAWGIDETRPPCQRKDIHPANRGG